MSKQPTNVANDQAIAATADTTDGEQQAQGKQRKGRGAKHRQAERFREKKNKEFGAQLDKKIEDLKISLGYTPADLFGERRLNPVVRPQLEVPITTQHVGEICDLTSEVLHTACKVPPAPGIPPEEAIQYDAETLKFVTSLQIESKLYHARCGSQYPANFDDQPTVQRVDQLLPDALVPLGVYIDQIGRFSIDGQVFIPSESEHAFVYDRLNVLDNEARDDFACFRDAEVVPVGAFALNANGPRGGVMHGVIAPDRVAEAAQAAIIVQIRGDNPLDLGNYALNPAFVADPNAFPWFGILQMNEIMPPALIPDFPQIVTRYAELRGRVNKKLKDVFIELNLTKGTGTEVLLVYSADIGNGLHRTWSPRTVKDDALEMGAILGYGSDGPLRQNEVSSVETIVDVSAGLQSLASVLTKKLR